MNRFLNTIRFFVGSSILVLAASLTYASTQGVLTYPVLQPTEGLNNPNLAIGLNGVEDWSVQMPFINHFKTARTWIGHLPDQFGGVETAELQAAGVLDEHGWVTHIPSNVSHIGTIWDWSSNNQYGAQQSRQGRYVLSYVGEGSLSLNGVTIVSQQAGKIVFNNDNGSTFSVDIMATDPNDTGDYIREIVVVREDQLDLYKAGAIFNPKWIEFIKDMRMLRFMDWMGTNGSKITHWEEYPNADWYTWTEHVPVSIMVRLANEIGIDPWFNMPFNANNNFSQQFAIYVRDNLDENLIAHIELSNEVWNFIFPQAIQAAQIAENTYGVADGPAWLNYYGQRASEVMATWTTIFGNQTSQRLKRVAGSFTPVPYYSEQILIAPLWQQHDPVNYTPPHTYFDALAITTYFGSETIVEEDSRNALLAAINDPNINEHNWHRDILIPLVQDASEFTAQKSVAQLYSLDLLSYEGGQHVHHSAGTGLGQEELGILQNHLVNFVRSPQMATVYQESYTTWKNHGDGAFMQFVDISSVNIFGSWGLLASLNDTSPRAEFLLHENDTNITWWENRGGNHFQNGRTITGSIADNILAGTNAEDFILAGAGSDIIYPGLGNDGVNGGAGDDTVMLRGNQSEYTITQEGKGYRIIGLDGINYVYAVETLYFEDGSRLQLAEITNQELIFKNSFE
jgi:hypothetical protein